MTRRQPSLPPKRPQSILGAHLGTLHMDISSNREVILEGNNGILEYNDRSIKINAGQYIVSFQGRGLHIRTMSERELVIHGFLTSIEYII